MGLIGFALKAVLAVVGVAYVADKAFPDVGFWQTLAGEVSTLMDAIRLLGGM